MEGWERGVGGDYPQVTDRIVLQVMELYAKQRTVLELEYFGEVGTGLGPTLEFFTLLSHELQKRSLGLWRHEDNVQQKLIEDR